MVVSGRNRIVFCAYIARPEMRICAAHVGRLGLAVAMAISAACKEEAPPPPPPPPEVYVAGIVQRDVPEYLELVGQAEGNQDVEIRARVEGFLLTQDFTEGSFVKKGQLLYTIDPQTLEATLARAKANQAAAQTALDKSTNDVKRYTPLAAKQAVSQRELDDALSEQEAARSEVKAAAAAVERARLDLGYARVTSPIDGLIGATKVKPGNLVGKGEPTLLTVVSQLDPIRFRVGITEADYLRITRRNPALAARARTEGIQLTLADGTVFPHKGRLGPVDRAVDPQTGTLGAQLIFPNPGNVLRPGQYGRVRALVDVRAGALLVPQIAVQQLQNLYSVAVVNPDETISFRNVKVGPRVDTEWVIEEGLKPGERVVAQGLQFIKDGQKVRVKPYRPSGAEPEEVAVAN
jgi:membrane fusion protein, multidrug efflux system